MLAIIAAPVATTKPVIANPAGLNKTGSILPINPILESPVAISVVSLATLAPLRSLTKPLMLVKVLLTLPTADNPEKAAPIPTIDNATDLIFSVLLLK